MKLDVSTPVPIADGTKITYAEFQNKYHIPQQPVILKGLWKQYPAYEKWTMEYFKETMGDIEVGLFSSSKADPSETMKVPQAKMHFDKYLELIENEPTDLRLFLFPVFKHKPELLKDFGYPNLVKKYIKLPFMFFGPKNSITRIHQDIDMSCVFLTQFEGKKRVVLFPPAQSKLLYRLPFNVHSTIDIDHPDFDTYPGLNYVKGMTAILEYGDTLYMPSGYWHHIEYLEGGYGLSIRSWPPTIALTMKAVMNLTVRRKFDDIMRMLFHKKWFEYKLRIAHNKADREIRNLKLN
ncbi:MAG: cupin-like domain-containing protein [Fimbriimonadaceae bacterium]|nr:cupin-like domain-containing protein [Chitinophagales bacterium]